MSLDEFIDIYSEAIHNQYVNTKNKHNTNIEFEIRFDKKKINQSVFEKVFADLILRNYKTINSGYSLNISVEYETANETTIESNVRVELDDIKSIQSYCYSNNILPDNSKYIMKEDINALNLKQMTYDEKMKYKKRFLNKDYGFRVSIQKEITQDPNISINVKDIMEKWPISMKVFRYKYRTSLVHKDLPNIRIDLTKVRTNEKKKKSVDFLNSGILNEDEVYEIEIEIINITKSIDTDLKKDILIQLRKSIKYILSSIQGTMFPVTYSKITSVLYQYMSMLKFQEIKPNMGYRKESKCFIGPSSCTLQSINLVNNSSLDNICIQKDNYCVTDKADGERKLLFVYMPDINKDLELYFINMNLDIQFTGLLLPKSYKKFANTILDGEYIDTDKYNKKISLYAAFDVYYSGEMDYRPFQFRNSKLPNNEQRYYILNDYINEINEGVKSVSETNKMQIVAKQFYFSYEENENSIYESIEECFDTIKNSEYNTDGLIFTPMHLGVTQENPEDEIKKFKYTWAHSFKWKPPEYNTIDFLISVANKEPKEKFENGNIIKYNVVMLKVGVNKKFHGLIGSQKKILNNDIQYSTTNGFDYNSSYSAELFYPSNPSDLNAHLCHIPLHLIESNEVMITEENEIIENDTIVEFRYDLNEKNKMNRWKPLRIRLDKTNEYRKKKNNFGNAYHVANNNWQSIHNPVTKELLTGKTIITANEIFDIDSDVYYNNSNKNSRHKSKTIELRNFHNHIKNLLIKYVSSKQNDTSLIDMAVGKAGDLQKWVNNNVKYVLGIDLSEDNIHNPHDGACKRYIDLYQTKRKRRDANSLVAMFISGDTSKNIENGSFDDNKKDKDDDITEEDMNVSSYYILSCLMGYPTVNKSLIKEEFLVKNYEIFKNKFDVCSIQFALHYMFESEVKLHNFLKNVSDMTHVGSYFIGTCYDGKKIYKEFKTNGNDDNSIELYKDSKKIWSIDKKYNDDDDLFMSDTNSSLGFKISVYQESINQKIDEYLVNFDYFKKVMADYGFILDDSFSVNKSKISSVDNFEVLYNINHKSKQKMSKEEKKISFMNNYFVFKKVRDVVVDVMNNDGIMENQIYNIEKAIKINKKIKLVEL
uniref:mRNA (guanine-N(7))-methyltransferase n=1 Tax=Florenciella sp. virus SA2 TaxID=3240092 RepID=A0AB39JCK8_9VIRU